MADWASTLSVFPRIILSSFSPEIDCLQSVSVSEDVAPSSRCVSILLWSAQEPSRSLLFRLRRTRRSEQGEAVEPPALLPPNSGAVASD